MAKKKNPQFVTPAGTASFPYITKADFKFNAGGVFKVRLLLDPDEDGTKKLIAKIESALDEAYDDFTTEQPKLKKLKYAKESPVSPDLDDDGEETGKIAIKFSQKRLIEYKDRQSGEQKSFEATVPVYDAKGGKVTKAVYGGSVIKVCFEIVPYCMASTKKIGVSLRLIAVQVINLVTGSGDRAADHYGFGEEDGYVDEGRSESFPEGGDGGEAGDGSDDENPDF
jgi:hypothetical protein